MCRVALAAKPQRRRQAGSPREPHPSGCHARPAGLGPVFGARVLTANARAARPALGNLHVRPRGHDPAEAWPSGHPNLTIVCQAGQGRNQHPTEQTLCKRECTFAGRPAPRRQAPRGAPGSTSSVRHGGPPGQARQNVARPRAHSHQKPALQGPPVQGVPPRPLPRTAPDQHAASGAGPLSRAGRARLPWLFSLWGRKAPGSRPLHAAHHPPPPCGGDGGPSGQAGSRQGWP